MNALLWTLQGLLAAHTVMGAVWKFSNSEQSVPSLQAIPHGVWLGMSIVELLLAVGLVAPAVSKSFSVAAPSAAACIAAEMIVFVALHLASGHTKHGQMIYWLIVAALCAYIVYGRLILKPV